MKIFFCKCALWVVELLLGMKNKPSDQSDLTDLPDPADLKKAGMMTVEELKAVQGITPEEWAERILQYVPAVDVEVTLYGGPADGWVERIAAGKRWPEMLLARVGNEVHAYEHLNGRAVFRHVRQVGSLGVKSEN